jgi:hypothetical protein
VHERAARKQNQVVAALVWSGNRHPQAGKRIIEVHDDPDIFDRAIVGR